MNADLPLPPDQMTERDKAETPMSSDANVDSARGQTVENDEMNPDEAVLANPQWGSISMLAAAASFGGIIPGPVASAYSNLLWTVELHGDNSLSNGGGTLESFFREKFEGVDENGEPKDKDSLLDVYADMMMDEREDQKRELEEWQRETHSFAGQDWTGKEWAQAAEDLKRGSKGYDWLIDYLMKDGQTRNEAEKTANDMQLAASGNSKPEAARTKDEQTAIDHIANNPEAAKAYKAYKEAQNSGFAPIAADNAIETRAGQTASVDAGSDGLYEDAHAAVQSPDKRTSMEDVSLVAIPSTPLASADSEASAATDEKLFPSAPNLTEHHQAAVAATEPLDTGKRFQVAAAPQPSANAGLDI